METELVQIWLEIILAQAMISSQNKRLGVADHYVEPVEQVEHIGVGVKRLIFVVAPLQSRDVTAVSIAVDGTTFGKCRLGKLSDSFLLQVWRNLHFEIA